MPESEVKLSNYPTFQRSQNVHWSETQTGPYNVYPQVHTFTHILHVVGICSLPLWSSQLCLCVFICWSVVWWEKACVVCFVCVCVFVSNVISLVCDLYLCVHTACRAWCGSTVRACIQYTWTSSKYKAVGSYSVPLLCVSKTRSTFSDASITGVSLSQPNYGTHTRTMSPVYI